MGIIASSFDLINDAINWEEMTTQGQNGTIITKRRNPYVSGITVAGTLVLLIAYIDGGNGMISKVLGRR